MDETETRKRDCERCNRPFDVPVSGPASKRKMCYNCSPPRQAVVLQISPEAARSNSEPVFTSDMPGNAFPAQSLQDPEYIGPFQQRAKDILEKYENHDEAKGLAALAIAKALDSADITGAQIGGLVTKWLAIMDAIKAETPAEPDEVDDLSGSAQRKMMPL